MPVGTRNWPTGSPAKIPVSHASTGCMVLHALSCPAIPFADPSWRGLSLSMHLHENRPTKRAGEVGKALRADDRIKLFSI